MLFEKITILDQALEVQTDQFVGVKNGRIEYIGAEAPTENYGAVYNGKEKLLMSGFFNSHAHTPMTLLRGYGENMMLQDWLTKRIFPFEGRLNGEDIYYATLLGIAESVRFGIVSTTDMYYFCDRMAEAFLQSGAKNNLGRGITCFTDQNLTELTAWKESKELYESYHGAGAGKLRVDMSLHAEYTSTPTIVKQLAEYTKELGTGMHVHLSETKTEYDQCKERHGGKTPTAYLAELGLFDSPTTAAHCVWLDEDDYDILAEKGVTVATCPVSNLKLASGICNVPKFLEKRVNVAIGTDGVSSNNSLNMIEEIKYFALLQKERRVDPTLITPKEAIYAATKAGAIGQRRNDTGTLAVGYAADLIVINLAEPHMHPIHDLKNNLVYSASGSDVVLTMIDGEIVYRDGEYPTIDIERVKQEATRSKERILRELSTLT